MVRVCMDACEGAFVGACVVSGCGCVSGCGFVCGACVRVLERVCVSVRVWVRV